MNDVESASIWEKLMGRREPIVAVALFLIYFLATTVVAKLDRSDQKLDQLITLETERKDIETGHLQAIKDLKTSIDSQTRLMYQQKSITLK